MVEPASSHAIFSDSKAIPAGNVSEIANCRHCLEVHREIGMGHLRFKDALQAVTSDKFRSKTIEVKFILRRIKRGKEGNALNMVPVVMRNEDFGLNLLIRRGRQPVTENPETRAAIQDQPATIRRDQLETRRVSAIAPRGPVYCRRRSTHAPEAEFGHFFCHSRRKAWDLPLGSYYAEPWPETLRKHKVNG